MIDAVLFALVPTFAALYLARAQLTRDLRIARITLAGKDYSRTQR